MRKAAWRRWAAVIGATLALVALATATGFSAESTRESTGGEHAWLGVYTQATDWDAPALRVASNPPLDVMAIDNLPSMLPVEASQDYAGQLLASLKALDRLDAGVWGRARVEFDRHLAAV